MGEFKRLTRELVYRGTILEVYKDHVDINGHQEIWDYFHHGGGAAVVAVTCDGKILMVRQYRNAVDRYTIEIPGGVLDAAGESGAECDARELEEETGFIPGKIEHLITLRSLVAFTDEKTEVYVATDLIPSAQHLDEGEAIEIEEHSVEELKEKILSGEIEDAKTVAAIMAYLVKYEAYNELSD